jgi:hypothetical protein
MTDAPLMQRSSAPRSRALSAGTVFGVIGGPLAWYAQLCAGYALASGPCFANARRGLAPLTGYAWTGRAMIGVLIAGVVIALAALIVSSRAFARARHDSAGDLAHADGGRQRFLALWGIWLGAGFAVATLMTAIAFVVLPRCAG